MDTNMQIAGDFEDNIALSWLHLFFPGMWNLCTWDQENFLEICEFWIVHLRLKNRIRDGLMLSMNPSKTPNSVNRIMQMQLLISVKQVDNWTSIPTSAANRQITYWNWLGYLWPPHFLHVFRNINVCLKRGMAASDPADVGGEVVQASGTIPALPSFQRHGSLVFWTCDHHEFVWKLFLDFFAALVIQNLDVPVSQYV